MILVFKMYYWQGNKVIVEKVGLGENYCQWLLVSKCVEKTRKAVYSALMLKAERGSRFCGLRMISYE